MKKPVAFFSVVSDLFSEYGKMMENSIKKFHPDIPIIIFGEEYMKEVDKKEPVFFNNVKKSPTTFSYCGSQLSKEYDLLIRIDADCIVCGPLDEILHGDFDVAAPIEGRNPYEKDNIMSLSNPYMVSGFFACRNEEFWNRWQYMNEALIHLFPINIDNDTFTLIFNSKLFDTKILDDENTSVYYGNSSNPFWSEYYMDGDKIMCKGKQVKIMHRAGSSRRDHLGTKEHTYRDVGFPEDVCKRFDFLVS